MSRSFAERFPTVARLMGLADAESEEGENAGGEGEGPKDGEDTDRDNQQDEGADGAGDGEGADGDGNDGGEGVGGEGEGAGASALAGVRSATLESISGATDAQLMAGFERDAGVLISAERVRCISVFTSDAGRRNPNGAALLLGDEDMAAVGADKIVKLLGTTSTASRSAARDRLQTEDSRPDTGSSTDAAAGATDAIAKHRERAKKRNPKGGKKVGAAPSAPAEDK